MAIVKIKLFAFVGILLIVLGIATIIHRNIMMPAHTERTNFGDQMIITETRRIVRVPMPASVILILAGCCLLLLSTRES